MYVKIIFEHRYFPMMIKNIVLKSSFYNHGFKNHIRSNIRFHDYQNMFSVYRRRSLGGPGLLYSICPLNYFCK